MKTRIETKKRFLIALVMLLTVILSVVFVFAETSATPSTSTASVTSTTTSSNKLRFVVWPDTHIGFTGDSGLENPTKKAIDVTLNQIKPAFVLHTGDMIDIDKPGSAKDPKLALMWSRLDKEMVQPFLAKNILFFPSPGNHDYHGARERYKEHWSKHKNNGYPITGPEGYASYYSFDAGNSHFVSLTAPGTTDLLDSNTQIAWLKQDLEQAQKKGAQNFFVFSHSPIFCPKLNTRCTSDGLWLRNKKLLALLKQYKAVHFGGHMHVYSDRTYEGVRSFIDGMLGGGKRKLAGKAYQNFQFLVVDVDGTNYRVTPIEYPSMDLSVLSEPPPSPTANFASAGGATSGIGGCPPGSMPKSMLSTTTQSTIASSPFSSVSQTPGRPSGSLVSTENDPGVLCNYCNAMKTKLSQIYPDAEKQCKGYCCTAKCPPGTKLNKAVPLFKQCSPDIRKVSCSGDTCSNGCGHTSFKMVTAGLGLNIAIDDLYCSDKAYFLGGPANWEGLDSATKKLNLQSERIKTSDWNSVKTALQSGKVGMQAMGDKQISQSKRERCGTGTGGHWIALVGAADDYVIINDPAGNCGNDQEYHMVLSKSYFQSIEKNGEIIVWSKPSGQSIA